MHVLSILILVNVLHKQITLSENIPPQRREVVVCGDGNRFYRAVALRKDEMSREKHEEIPGLSDRLFEINPKVFELPLFSSTSLNDLVRKSKITGTPAETVDINSVVHRSLATHLYLISCRRRKGPVLSRLSMLVRSHWSQQRSNVYVGV